MQNKDIQNKEKDELRQIAKSNLLDMPIEEKKVKDLTICKKLLNLQEYRQAKIIAGYFATGYEVDLAYFIQSAIADAKELCMPVLSGNLLKFVLYTGNEEIYYNKYKIKEIKGEYVEIDKIDLAVVPSSMCDHKCNRLGKGAGYYDRVFADRNLQLVAPQYKINIIRSLPIAPWDLKMDLVLSEEYKLFRKSV